MSTFVLRANALSTQTGLTVRLYASGDDSIANGAGGDTLTETSSSDGQFTATVAESLSGLYDYAVYKSGSAIWTGQVYCSGTTWVADDLLSVVKAKTDLIGTGSASLVSAPVADDGTIESITIGDAYLSAHSRAFQWTVAAVSGINVADATTWFGGSALGDATGSWLVEGEVTDAGGGDWLLTFELISTDTSACEVGQYNWTVSVRDASGNEITKVRKDKRRVTQLLKKFTTEE